MSTLTFSPRAQTCGVDLAPAAVRCPVSTKLRAYIALLETAPLADVERLLQEIPEDLTGTPAQSPYREARAFPTEAPTTVVSPHAVVEVPEAADGDSSGDEGKHPIYSSRAKRLDSLRQLYSSPRNGARKPVEFDELTRVALRGDTLLTGYGGTPGMAQHAVMKLAQNGTLVTQLSKDQGPVSVRKQGNLEYYHDDVLQRRLDLFHSNVLQGVFRALFEALPLENGRLTEYGYCWLYKRLYWRVVKGGKKADCEALAQAEWAAESEGEEFIDFEHFYEGMFNFVDTWCDNDGEGAYLAFAENLCNPLVNELIGEGRYGLTDHEKLRVRFEPPGLCKLLVELQMSNERIASYQKQGIGPRQVYQAECSRLGIDPHPAVIDVLPDEAGFTMDTLKLSGVPLTNLGPLVDVIRMSKDLRQVYLKNCNLDSNSTTLLSTALVLHDKLEVLDISGNEPVTLRGATAINRLLCRNSNITTCRFAGTVPTSMRGPITVQLEANFHAHRLAREEYLMIKAAFQEMDHNKDGLADLQELVRFFQKFDFKKSTDTSTIEQKARWRTQRAAERVAKNFLQVADGKGRQDRDMRLTFCELLGYFYPNISLPALQRFIDAYEDPESLVNLTNDAIKDIFRRFDTDGSKSLSLRELQEGLVQSGHAKIWEKYKATFQRFDLNRDDAFSLEEFTMLMTVIDCYEARPATVHSAAPAAPGTRSTSRPSSTKSTK